MVRVQGLRRPCVLGEHLDTPLEATHEVVGALYAPTSLRLDNRTPADAPTFQAVCAPTADLRLIIVVCTRTNPFEPWTIVGARDASDSERAMWRKHTS